LKKYIITTILLILFFSGCAKNEPLYSTMVYKNIQNDYILNAAKKVVLLADDRFRIDSQADSIKATRAITKFKIYSADLEINTIYITTTTDNNTVIAKLKINHKDDYFDDEKLITNQKEHKFIWDRINYILGLKKTWPTCLEHNLKLNFDGILCNRIYNKDKAATKEDLITTKKAKNSNNIDLDSVVKPIKLEKMDNIVLPNSKYINTSDVNSSSKFINLKALDSIKLVK
jgi:hypothetical protein